MKPRCACHGEDLDAHIQEIVDRAPPLTEAQKARLAAIFRSVERRPNER